MRDCTKRSFRSDATGRLRPAREPTFGRDDLDPAPVHLRLHPGVGMALAERLLAAREPGLSMYGDSKAAAARAGLDLLFSQASQMALMRETGNAGT